MDNVTLQHIFDQHYITTLVVADRLLVLEAQVDVDMRRIDTWIDVTGWTWQKAMNWLGY